MVRCLFIISCILVCSVLGKNISGSDLKYAPFRYEEKTDLEPHPKENVCDLK